jgi:hypothetical protein
MSYAYRSSRRYCRSALILPSLFLILLGQIFLAAPARATFNRPDNDADAILGQIDFSKAATNVVDQYGLSVGLDSGAAINATKASVTFGVNVETLRTRLEWRSVSTARCG